ncbi:tetratricopeptide repeat protein [Singulisphaera sp. Ch08]|uniref:Tetratricopeptide repeat protein n=1 Tax=Singulisphaera sp. Ch08 TaxID=3120278 RepID=A0AAU7CMV7_9BACT
MHKKTFLKPVIKGSEFCSTCHKVSLPYALNHYKDFLRGQNHYDTFLLSGVSGHGARSFYYPPVAKSRCVDCHMNLQPSRDFGARDFDGKGGREIHNHLFLGANTGLAAIRGNLETAAAQAKFLQDQKVRIDLFALREGGGIDGRLLGPLRPDLPSLKPGQPYLVEVVVRTLGLGHPLSQGTADSNEIWVELIAKAGDRVIGRSGAIDDNGEVDPYAHFINVFMLDRHGKRIDRRNPQDIFVPLYNKQVPPGAGQVVHFGLTVPDKMDGPLTLEAKVNYRKFDRTYMDFIFGKGKGPALPTVVMAADSVQLPVNGKAPGTIEASPIKEVWQRWNDYGIGLLLEGGDKGGQKGELKQAEPIFRKVAELGRIDGWVNLARLYLKEGRIGEARDAIEKAATQPQPPAPWVIHWLTGQINERNGRLDEAIASYEAILGTTVPERGFDFSLDYEVVNALGGASYARARLEPVASEERLTYLRKSIAAYRRTLAIDTENVAAHYGLGLAYADPSWNVAPANLPKAEQESEKPASEITDEILAKTERTAQASISARSRAAHALGLAESIAQLVKRPRPEFGSRLDPLFEVIQQLGPVWERETDPSARFALSSALKGAHKTMHQLLKPDETAEGLAVAIARQNSTAADQNAQSIVIHSLHRVEVPRLDPGNLTDQKPSASPIRTKP